MGSVSKTGFDLVETRVRLEDWCLQFFVWPVGPGFCQWPAGKAEAVRLFLEIHWGEHGIPTLIERKGQLVPAPRCSKSRCRVLGVALAVLEIFWYEVTLLEREEAAWLGAAASRYSLSERVREALLTHAHQLEGGFISRAVDNETAGRPAMPLAHAVAQHLWDAGFSHSQIGEFMGCSADAARKRCKADNRRSLSAFVETLEPPSAAESR